MSGSVTGFGTIFALVAAYCVLFNRKWLLPLTGLAVVLQAPSVIAVDASWGRVGVGAFTLCALLMVIHGGLAFAPRRRTLIAEFVNARELRPWSVFFLVALVSSVLGPLVFTGLLVYPPLDKLGVDEIIAEPMHEHGMGIAMMDRLRRAAAKSIPAQA